MSATRQARFISLDGIDGTGKSTQCHLLAEWLRSQKIEVVTCRDPGGTVLGDKLRAILLDHHDEMTAKAEAFLFMASRAELVGRVIRPALDRGAWVVSDRYILANVVYQGYGGKLNPKDIWKIGEVATGGILPDLTLVLDLPIDAAANRRTRSADRMEKRDREYHEAVRHGFLTEAGLNPGSMQVIDATGDLETVQSAIQAAVQLLIDSRGPR